MDEQFIRTHREAGVSVIELDRCTARHALSTAVLLQLRTALDDAAHSAETRALVVTTTGTGPFCAGGDIREMATMSMGEGSAYIELGKSCVRALETLRFPTVAAVHGSAFGGGLELAMSCDLLIAAAEATFALPEVKLGIIPGFGGIPRLLRRVGYTRAQWMVLTGESIPAETALKWGLVHEVMPAAQVRTSANDLARRFANGSTTALCAAKRALAAGADLALDAGLEAESAHFLEAFRRGDRLAGMQAFIDRRAPVFE